MGMKQRRQSIKMCEQPDRHEPKLKCGYPLPCPHHTVLVVISAKNREDHE